MKLSCKQITNVNAMEVLREGLEALKRSDFVVDLSGVERIDSSAIAVALRWKKEAQKLGGDLKFINASENLKKLSDLYNVSSLLISSSQKESWSGTKNLNAPFLGQLKAKAEKLWLNFFEPLIKLNGLLNQWQLQDGQADKQMFAEICRMLR